MVEAVNVIPQSTANWPIESNPLPADSFEGAPVGRLHSVTRRVLVSTNKEDLQSVKMIQEGDREAFGSIYTRYRPRVFAYAYLRLGNSQNAEDSTHDIFLNALKGIINDKFKPIGSLPFAAWLFEIGHNAIISFRRAEQSRPHIPLEKLSYAQEVDSRLGMQVDEIVMRKITLEELIEGVKSLPRMQREVIALRFGGALSVRDTSHVLEKPEGAVKSLQLRAVGNLRKILKVEL